MRIFDLVFYCNEFQWISVTVLFTIDILLRKKSECSGKKGLMHVRSVHRERESRQTDRQEDTDRDRERNRERERERERQTDRQTGRENQGVDVKKKPRKLEADPFDSGNPKIFKFIKQKKKSRS